MNSYAHRGTLTRPALQAPQADAAPTDRASNGRDALHLEGVLLERRQLRLVTDLHLTVPVGTTLAVVGPSGAGKTTLLRAIAGLDAPLRGTITPPDGRAAVVFQEPRLLPWRTALDNVVLAAGGEDRTERALGLLAAWGVGDAARLYPSALSGGMRQRVALARALIGQPSLLLADEPFASLDAARAKSIRDHLSSRLHDRPRSVVWVTHDLSEAAAVATSTLILHGPPAGEWRWIDHQHRSSEQVVDALEGALQHLPLDPRSDR